MVDQKHMVTHASYCIKFIKSVQLTSVKDSGICNWLG